MTNTYEVDKKIDYISFSSDKFIPPDDAIGKPERVSPKQRNYNCCDEYECGMLVQWHTERQAMKQSVTVGGSALDNLRSIGMSDYDILHWSYAQNNTKYSRIDIALTSARKDRQQHELQPHKIHTDARNGHCQTRLKIDKPVTSVELEVETAYIGSRKSRNRLFRAYDKGLELGGIAGQIIRFELESRKSANNIAKELYKKRTDIGSVIRRYVDFPDNLLWIEICGQDISPRFREEITTSKQQREDEEHNRRVEWLLSSVAPALAKAMNYDNIKNGDNGLVEKFTSAVEYHMIKLENEGK